jgi:hypothetical protein
MPAAIFLASSLVMRFGVARLRLEVDIRHRKTVDVADDAGDCAIFLDCPRRREAVRAWCAVPYCLPAFDARRGTDCGEAGTGFERQRFPAIHVGKLAGAARIWPALRASRAVAALAAFLFAGAISRLRQRVPSGLAFCRWARLVVSAAASKQPRQPADEKLPAYPRGSVAAGIGDYRQQRPAFRQAERQHPLSDCFDRFDVDGVSRVSINDALYPRYR